MNAVEHLLKRWAEYGDAPAVAGSAGDASYAEILRSVDRWQDQLTEIPRGAVVAVRGDFSPDAVALFTALAALETVIVPLTDSTATKHESFLATSGAEFEVDMTTGRIASTHSAGRPGLYDTLVSQRAPGLVLFSSGSTGESKAAVHDLGKLLDKFRVERPPSRMLAFLLFDHIGGINTMFHTLSNGGTLVTVDGRDPDVVAAAIAEHEVETLPTSPTFLNLLLVSGAVDRHDLSSLRLITYGTEVMPEGLLSRVEKAFPEVRLLQTYGLSELGILRSQSRDNSSLWVRIGGEGFETRVVDGLLEIKAESAMLGYLNAENPFTEDGWFRTGDEVEVDGEWLLIKGRRSELINVGGEKVWPAEVENVIQAMDEVIDVAVRGEPNALTGHVVVARVAVSSDEDVRALRKRVQQHCRQHLPPFAAPARVEISTGPLHGGRFKKVR